MAAPKDLYMQFADVSVDYDSSDSSTLVDAKVDTGLSIRGQLIWLIHLIEIMFSSDDAAQTTHQQVAISTREGLAAMPDLGEAGVLVKAEKQFFFVTSGLALMHQPLALHYLPPIPIAAPSLHVYAQTTIDNSYLRGDTVEIRFGFTTAPLDSKAYTEIAETWGW